MSKKTTKSSKTREGPEYEGYVSNIVRQMEEFRGAVIERNKRFDGVRQPGKYEIDIALILQKGSAKLPIRIFIIFECKHHRRRVDRPLIQKFVQTRDAISADKAIFVSPVGYTKEAIQVAAAFGVERWIIRPQEQETLLMSRAGGDVITKDLDVSSRQVLGPVVFGSVGRDLIGTIITVPATNIDCASDPFEPVKLLEPFDLHIENEYETNMPKFPVKLGVIVTARIVRLKDIECYLSPRRDVPQLMKDAIDHEVRRFLHTVNPERFYLRFSYRGSDEEPAIEQTLRELIKKSLEEKFKAEVIDIVFQIRDTEITQLWSNLEKSEATLEFTLPSFEDWEGVTYRGRIRVERIHPEKWNKFRISHPDIDKIRRWAEEHVQAQLGSLSNVDLAYTDFQGQRQIERVIELLAKKSVLEEFGLVIRVTNIHREITSLELNERDRIREVLNGLKELESRRIREIRIGGTSEEIKAIEERVQVLEDMLPANLYSTVVKPRQRFEALSYDDLRLKCLADLVGYEPRSTEKGERAKALTYGTPAFELSNLVLEHLSTDAAGRSIFSQWKSDQRKRLEKYGLPKKPLNDLLQAVIDGNEEHFDAVRSRLLQH